MSKEMYNFAGYHTQNFVSEMYRVTDSVTTTAQTAATNFSWLDKYKTAGNRLIR